MEYKIINIIIAITFIVGCRQQEDKEEKVKESKDEFNLIYQDVGKALDSLNLIGKYQVGRKGDSLLVQFLSVENYHLLDRTNKIIAHYLLNSIREEIFEKIEYVEFEFSWEKISNNTVIAFDKALIEKSFTGFKKTSLFNHFFKYLMQNIKEGDIIQYNIIIDGLREYRDDFSFKGDFWKLLHQYSLVCHEYRHPVQEDLFLVANICTAKENTANYHALNYILNCNVPTVEEEK